MPVTENDLSAQAASKSIRKSLITKTDRRRGAHLGPKGFPSLSSSDREREGRVTADYGGRKGGRDVGRKEQR